DNILIKSPDGHLSFQLSPGEEDLLFTIVSGNIPVISSSPLRFSLDGKLLTGNGKVSGVRRYTIREKYPWLGAHNIAVNQCNGAELQMKGEGVAWSIDIRVFDNGAAFRIIVPGADSAARVPGEGTVFTLPGNATIWYHDLNGHYEGVHVKKELLQVQAGEWVAPPATFKLTQGLYVAVTEADLQGYSGIAFQVDGKSGLVVKMADQQPPSHPYVLRYSAEDVARLSKPAVIRGTVTTPWRVVMIGKDLNTMVNNDILHDLCPPPDPSLFPQGIHTDWIRPGRAVWKYLDGGGDGTPETMKKFTDEAADTLALDLEAGGGYLVMLKK
ncbi:MAG TPA: glycoside hydrolase family 97 N-terminal domain-containing protein, partial [Puia sp.]